MAFYSPPGAPAQGGLTVDSSRYADTSGPQYQQVPNPFEKAYEIKKRAMEMKRAERQETEATSGEEQAKMENAIFSMGDDASKFNPDDILEGGVFNASELKNRRFTSTLKADSWKKYQNDARLAGGLANRMAFEEVWAAMKSKEDGKIINEMWSDVQSNRMSEKEFNLALRDEGGEAFRNYWKDMSTERKKEFQANLEANSWNQYAPGYETTWESLSGTGPTDEEQDRFTSPLATGIYTAFPALGIAASPKARRAIAKPFKALYGAAGGDRKALLTETNKLRALRQEARALGFNPYTGKAIKGTKANPTLRMQFNTWNKSAEGGVKLKALEAQQKAGTKVNQELLKKLQSERGRFKSDIISNQEKIKKAKKSLLAQQKVVAGKQSKGGRFSPKGVPKGLGRAAMKGLSGQFMGEIAAMPTRMLLGDETKGARLTNEAIETIGTQAGRGSGQIAMLSKIKNKIKKNGMAWALKKVAQKGGVKLAMSVGSKAILGTAGGLVSGVALTALSVGMLSKDLYDIYNILAE